MWSIFRLKTSKGSLNGISVSKSPYLMSNKTTHQLHARVHRTPKQCKCALCGSIFRNLGSLKRHAVSVHCIVPESAFPDNPKDKDFEASVELDSDSESRSSTSDSSTAKPARRRKRRPGQSRRVSHANTTCLPSLLHNKNNTLNNTTSWLSDAYAAANTSPSRRRRGRPRRSGARMMKSLDNYPDVNRIDSLTISSQLKEAALGEFRSETRYRTILPRPPGGSVSDFTASQPVLIDGTHRRRNRRSKRGSLKSVDLTVLPTDKRDSASRQSGTFFGSDMTAQTQVTQAVCLDHFVMASGSYVAVDPLSYSAGAYAIEASGTDESNQLVCKPPHVLTVAAAYASQLPPGSIPTSSTEDCEALLRNNPSAECDTSNSTVVTNPVQSAPMISSIQIYPTPWIEDQQQNVMTGPVTPVDVSEIGHTTSQSAESEVLSSQNSTIPISVPLAQPVQLYPILSPDGVTTLYYYMATPVEIVQTPTTAVCSQAVVDSSTCLDPCPTDSVQPYQHCGMDEKIEVIELDASQFEYDLKDSITDEFDRVESQLSKKHKTQTGSERRQTHEFTLTRSDEVPNDTVVATEVVDLGSSEQSESFFNYAGSSQIVESLDPSTDSTSIKVEKVSPSDINVSLSLSVESSTKSPSLHPNSDRSLANVSADMDPIENVTHSTSAVPGVDQANIPPFTQLFPRSRSNANLFDEVVQSTNDDLRTPLVGMNEMFTFSDVAASEEQHSASVEDSACS
ncbi:hypothetical protein FGIG_07838 [Fasciola gigantica]|uniref:C2H2-type domain-containing protein n=1 Tax=Fasciola gigantica TaxID=46835 RepID=A0A504YXR4_FASGI|nr:hypothetical protein FGIG_07838 [Fasciola gigantica]